MADKRTNVEQLGDAEDKAVRALEPDLTSHLELTADLFNFIAEALAQLPEVHLRDMSQSRKALTALLIRLGNDLRCASLLAIRGYPIQAAGLVSSMYEVAFTAAFIGGNEVRAQAWIDHDNPARSFKGAFELTKEVMRAAGVPDFDARVAQKYRVYSQLCMAKHANPLTEMSDTFVMGASGIVFTNGPRTSPSAIRGARFALEHAAGLSFIGLVALIQNHAGAASQELLLRQLEILDERHKRLNEESLGRYGDEDPFPGKW